MIYTIPTQHCPSCATPLDRTMPIAGPIGFPKSGDISVCAYCRRVLCFQDGSLRVVPESELATLPSNIQAMLRELANRKPPYTEH